MALGKPFIAINHLEAHILTATLTESSRLALPHLVGVWGALSVDMGGSGRCKYYLLGQTLDDSVGEAFDKTARLLGLPWPGGPASGTVSVPRSSRSLPIASAYAGSGGV